ncbi:DNA primase [Salicibibacter kimchii]|uniref:DNA primase n=1 Tax=Salicibibacter kimchii TaxID=2099786 RepID=A0A345BX69_9BACI|nr:DNA primase [Salicibibacter kimchii]AXF55550.1 DNA primase [Salicibibacter kimchii]
MNKQLLYISLSCIFAFNLLSACNGEAPEDDEMNGDSEAEENLGGDDLDEDVEDEGIDEEEDPEADPEDEGDDQNNEDEIYSN